MSQPKAPLHHIKFCKECNCIMRYKEDREARKLFLVCSNCEIREAASQEDMCAHEHLLFKDHSNQLSNIDAINVVNDPTLPRSQQKTCERCGMHEVVFFQADRPEDESSLCLIFICVHCGHKWLG